MPDNHAVTYVLRLYDAQEEEKGHMFVNDPYGLPMPGDELVFHLGDDEVRCTVARLGPRKGSLEKAARGLFHGKIIENRSVYARLSEASEPVWHKLAPPKPAQKQSTHIRIRTRR